MDWTLEVVTHPHVPEGVAYVIPAGQAGILVDDPGYRLPDGQPRAKIVISVPDE